MDDFRCVFDHNARFMSGALELNRHEFEKESRGHQQRHEDQLRGLSPSRVNNAQQQQQQSGGGAGGGSKSQGEAR